MIGKAVLAAGSAIAASAFNVSVAAAQIAPGSYALQTVGGQYLELEHDNVFHCQASLSLTINPGGAVGSITGGFISPGVAICSMFWPGDFDWPVAIGTFARGIAPIAITGVSFPFTYAGSCSGGALTGTINSNTRVVTITSSSGWISNPSIYNCSLRGRLSY